MPEPRMITIGNGRLSASISSLGADLSHLQDSDGRELMGAITSKVADGPDGPIYWTGHAPILFPVVGTPSKNTIRIEGQPHPMHIHGFALGKVFSVVEEEPERVVFALTDDAQTRAVYPFHFKLEIAFWLAGDTLFTEAVISNLSKVAMPASFGFHPAFAWPLPYGGEREAHRIIFASAEPDLLRRIGANGTIVTEPRPTPVEDRVLFLRDELFEADALIWDNIRSSSLIYGADGGPCLRIDFPNTPMLGIWTRPGEALVCVEPWHGIADPEGYAGEFKDKPGVFEVPVHGEKRIGMSVTLVR